MEAGVLGNAGGPCVVERRVLQPVRLDDGFVRQRAVHDVDTTGENVQACRRMTTFARAISALLVCLGVLASSTGAAATSSMSARVETDTTKIAFIRSGDIYVMNGDGKAQKRLTRYPLSYLDEVAWSPDGRKIAFVKSGEALAKTGSNAQPGNVYLVNVDGSRMRRVTRQRSFDLSDLSWSPGGGSLAYTHRAPGPEGTPHLFVTAVARRAERGLMPQLIVTAPDWSPDGRRIGIVVDLGGVPGSAAISTVSPDGTHLRRLTLVRNGGGSNTTWSPDGKTLLFLAGGCNSSSCFTEIRSISAAGGNARRLARLKTTYRLAPLWSPDGQRIVFVRNDDIWTMNTDGNQQRRVSSGPELDGSPSWSPDGTQIAFERYRSRGENYSIYVVKEDGSGLRRLTRGPFDGSPSWQPTRP